MNKEKQRIKIAEVRGWSNLQYSDYKPLGKAQLVGRHPGGSAQNLLLVPDYLFDLNAMHEAKRKLNSTTSAVFAHYLAQIVLGYGFDDADKDGTICLNGWATKRLIGATAAQQAEAFLKALNLWEDE